MQFVFVLDKNKKPLDPCHPARARKLLNSGKAAVFKRYPFTIILKRQVVQEETEVQEYRVKIDPGSKTTGIALVRESDNKVVWAAEIQHRGQAIRDSLLSRKANRSGRRDRHCRYRPARFDNRRLRKGWLPPSLESRLSNIETWVQKLARISPLTAISMELVKFDTQVMENPEISGVEYQQGKLQGYEVREYLLEKWERKCSYCGKTDVPLEIEHITPRSRGGSNRVSNLTLACHACNQSKGNKTAAEFGHPEIQAKAKSPLKDATAVNAIRWELWRRLSAWGIKVECGTGGRTKFNRTNQGFPKTHWLDAACVGESGANIIVPNRLNAIAIKAYGHGSRQMCRVDKFGFPRTLAKGTKIAFGFQTGDIVRAVVAKGKNIGTHVGRIAIRSSGTFDIRTPDNHRIGVIWKHCQSLYKSDGYSYTF
jgi:5-methylcytosine-specific restriction endonuclease McrA